MQKHKNYTHKKIIFITTEAGTVHLIKATTAINFIRKKKAELIYKTTYKECCESTLGKLMKTNIINKRIYRFGILNRIDIVASGIIIIAKTAYISKQIILLHKQQLIKKIYYAQVLGYIKSAQVLHQQLNKYHTKHTTHSSLVTLKIKPLILLKHLQQTLLKCKQLNKYHTKHTTHSSLVTLKIKPLILLKHLQQTLLKCKTYSGKYHQIRHMLKTIGKPIVFKHLEPKKLLLTLYKIKFYTYNPCI
ncbi:hypothetical protein JS520_00180 [Candidatus Vidania fulgoroideae]|nr:hypothetical protein JS520_00180 [Candidatus Vidania fulgoroideae]